MELPDAVKDAQMKGMNLLHRSLLLVSGGHLGARVGSMPVVELHTTGRSTGRRRSVMLTAPVHDEDRWVLVASKGGDDRHPDWYRNLVAHPDAELTVDGKDVPVHTRTATPEEKAELWPRIVDAYRGYASYQTKTSRDIPVVICTPR
jgi:deazaflavin-dependent oxidoreductase (nitroreductase family)